MLFSSLVYVFKVVKWNCSFFWGICFPVSPHSCICVVTTFQTFTIYVVGILQICTAIETNIICILWTIYYLATFICLLINFSSMNKENMNLSYVIFLVNIICLKLLSKIKLYEIRASVIISYYKHTGLSQHLHRSCVILRG